MFKLSQIKDHKMFILVLVIVFVGLGIYFIASAGKAQKKNEIIITNDDVQITVSSDPGGMQQSTDGLQKDVANPNLGAATIQDISGGTAGNPAQGANLDEILKDKEIEINK